MKIIYAKKISPNDTIVLPNGGQITIQQIERSKNKIHLLAWYGHVWETLSATEKVILLYQGGKEVSDD